MNPYLSVVNQRLHFARLVLEQAAVAERQGSNRLCEQALCQSALYQLETTYRFYLREVAVTYRCQQVEGIQSVEDLIRALQHMGKNPAEATELANLESYGGSWLNQLLCAHRQMLQVEQERVSQQSAIPLVQVDSAREAIVLTVELLQSWVKAFQELIDRHREHMLEC